MPVILVPMSLNRDNWSSLAVFSFNFSLLFSFFLLILECRCLFPAYLYFSVVCRGLPCAISSEDYPKTHFSFFGFPFHDSRHCFFWCEPSTYLDSPISLTFILHTPVCKIVLVLFSDTFCHWSLSFILMLSCQGLTSCRHLIFSFTEAWFHLGM